MNWVFHILLSLLFGFSFYQPVYGQSVVTSVHNLSVSGPGGIKASAETEVCIFCHTPHNSSPQKPLWNRQSPGLNYTLYNSSTIQSAPGQPDGSSILCLSCHDGTIALGSVLSRTEQIEMTGGISVMPDGHSNLTTDLSDDHPVSFIYNVSLSSGDGELVDPTGLTGPVKLQGEKMQCTSCHNPHDNSLPYFLVASRQYSDLCLYCHQKSGWEAASHKVSPSTWNGTGTNPWFHTPFTSVAENACENCHNPHTAEGNERLNNYINEENNCFSCHNGNVAGKDIQSDFGKSYRHDVYAYTSVHDPQENKITEIRHVECVDCHNAHQANSNESSAPVANGRLQGVGGVNSDGNPVSLIQFEYELCYRCHADNLDKPGSPTSRQIEQNNVRMEFDEGNPSFHPVEGSGQNNNVPSLIAPLTESSVIYCSDCHGSDSGTNRGPHGSVYPQILKFQYETTDYTTETYQAYELCYQCHDQNAIINNTANEFGEKVHKKHIVDADTPCNICHDPHGISGSQGTVLGNSHLINFDISAVRESTGMMGRLEFIDDGEFAGTCYLSCHGRNHNPKIYR